MTWTDSLKEAMGVSLQEQGCWGQDTMNIPYSQGHQETELTQQHVTHLSFSRAQLRLGSVLSLVH